MPEQDDTDAMTTNKTDREPDADQREDAPPPTRERWGQDCRFPLRFDPGFSSRSDPGCW